MKKRWEVKCGVDVLGYVEADTEEEAQLLMEEQYFNGNPYNDENLFLVEVKNKSQPIKQSIIYSQTIEFPNEEALKQYDEKMMGFGFEAIYNGPTINIADVIRRRFVKNDK